MSAGFTGCPCGCMTKLPYFDDPDCIRHQPIISDPTLYDYQQQRTST